MMPSIAVCMIVRDEENNLAECLQSVTEIARQIIVVDTGSIDATVQIAEKAGAEVHYFDWCDDFSAARNESIRYATADWILWIDADERLIDSTISYLKTFDRKKPVKPVALRVQIMNIQEDRQSYTVSTSHRFFSNHSGVRFTNRIHEQIMPSIQELGGSEEKSELVIRHAGYGLSKVDMTAKLARNRALLEIAAKENPDDPYMHFTLAQNLAKSGRHLEALPHYRRAIGLKRFDTTALAAVLNAAAESCLITKNVEEAQKYIIQSLDLVGHQMGGYFNRFRYYQQSGDVDGQITALRSVEKYNKSGASELPQDILVPFEDIYFELGKLLGMKGEYDIAAQYLSRCFQNVPANRDVAELLLAALFQSQKWEYLIDISAQITTPLEDNFKEMIGMSLMKMGRFHDAVAHYENWLQDSPGDAALRRRLAGLYGKLGDYSAAERILSQKV